MDHDQGKMGSQATRWVYTLNNPEEGDEDKVFTLETKWHVCGREVGEGGTPHLQGAFILVRKQRMSAIKNSVGIHRIHLEPMRGTPRQAREYCVKDGNAREHGDCPASNGKRTRDELAREFNSAAEASDLTKFAEANPGTWAWDGDRLVRNWLLLAKPIDRPDIRVEWIWGKPGVGKSRRAHQELPMAYVKCATTKWWNGYRLEKEVIIDDLAPNGIGINHLLRWFDRYKCNVEVKGSMVALHADKFIVTSNFSPQGVYELAPKDVIDALLRRITITYMP